MAVSGLTSRKVRTLLIMLGPVLGVAAIVAAIGINESSKGHLKAKLQELGTDLIVVNASAGFGFGQDPVIEAAAVAEEVVGHSLWGHVSKAGALPRGERLYPTNMPFVETLEEAAHFRKGPSVYEGQLSPWKEGDALSR